jgi:hypothetical protein
MFLPSRIAACSAVLVLALPLYAQNANKPVVHLTAVEDHTRTMELLNMRLIRLGKGGSDGRFPANYDEAKANPYPALPDPLVFDKKKHVTNAKTWWEKRRPQIVEAFDREVYGRVPANAPAIAWSQTGASADAQTGSKTQILTGHADNNAYPLLSVDIQLQLTLPANATKPVPVILNFDQALPAGATLTNWQREVLARGWGFAILATDSIQANSGAGLTEGVIGLANHGQPRGLEDWGALRAWAWGASRALDYLATNPAVDARQVGLEGHSRYGSAALVAMAYDQRFAIAYISSSGEAGAKLARRNWGETIENVADVSEYHWMAGNFLRYAGPLSANDLPVDAHELIALCAPRPVFLGAGSATGDAWADPRGMFLAEVAAGPVYTLLGKKPLAATSFPSAETPVLAGDLAFREHNGGHTPDPNWPTFLAFAGRYLTAPPPAAGKQVASNR